MGLRSAREAVGFLPDALRELVKQECGAIGRGLLLDAGRAKDQHGGEEWVEVFSHRLHEKPFQLLLMEYLFGLIFTILKVIVQASVYATLLLVLSRICSGFLPTSKVAKLTSEGRRVWRLSGLIALLVLCFIANTTWGNHGLGDYARIPLGNGEVIEEINGTEAYFQAEIPLKLSTGQPFIDSFEVANNVLCGKASDESFFTYDLVTKQQHIFADSQEYAAYAGQHALPAITDFKSFNKHYHDYWGGWRFWLLA